MTASPPSPLLKLVRSGEWWALFDDDGPVRTPARMPVVSHHREILEEVASDVARWGRDPTTKTTAFSLQASYLDFGIPVQRRVLEENTFAIWPDDIFRGEFGLDRDRFREALGRITLRQLVATMTAGHVLRSAVLGLHVVTGEDDLVPLTVAACGFSPEGAGGSPVRGRHVPTDRDESFCLACRTGESPDPATFRSRCALFPLLATLRRWSAFPEEVEKR